MDDIIRIKKKVHETFHNNPDFEHKQFDTLMNNITKIMLCYKESKFLIYNKERVKKTNICDKMLIDCYLDIISKNNNNNNK